MPGDHDVRAERAHHGAGGNPFTGSQHPRISSNLPIGTKHVGSMILVRGETARRSGKLDSQQRQAMIAAKHDLSVLALKHA